MGTRLSGFISQSSLHSPGFVTDNNALIFEEHQICSSANLHSMLQTTETRGLFVEDENKFIFSSVLVGHQAKARFKISNVGKIACDVNIVVKPVSSKVCSSTGPLPITGGRKPGRELFKTPALEPLYRSGDYLALRPSQKVQEGTGQSPLGQELCI